MGRGVVMRDLKSQKYPAYLTYELFMSPAFRPLNLAARDVLIQAYYEVDFTSEEKRNQKYAPVVANREESEKTIWQSFKQIMAHGFLKRVKHGGPRSADKAKGRRCLISRENFISQYVDKIPYIWDNIIIDSTYCVKRNLFYA